MQFYLYCQQIGFQSKNHWFVVRFIVFSCCFSWKGQRLRSIQADNKVFGSVSICAQLFNAKLVSFVLVANQEYNLFLPIYHFVFAEQKCVNKNVRQLTAITHQNLLEYWYYNQKVTRKLLQFNINRSILTIG